MFRIDHLVNRQYTIYPNVCGTKRKVESGLAHYEEARASSSFAGARSDSMLREQLCTDSESARWNNSEL